MVLLEFIQGSRRFSQVLFVLEFSWGSLGCTFDFTFILFGLYSFPFSLWIFTLDFHIGVLAGSFCSLNSPGFLEVLLGVLAGSLSSFGVLLAVFFFFFFFFLEWLDPIEEKGKREKVKNFLF